MWPVLHGAAGRDAWAMTGGGGGGGGGQRGLAWGHQCAKPGHRCESAQATRDVAGRVLHHALERARFLLGVCGGWGPRPRHMPSCQFGHRLLCKAFDHSEQPQSQSLGPPRSASPSTVIARTVWVGCNMYGGAGASGQWGYRGYRWRWFLSSRKGHGAVGTGVDPRIISWVSG